MSDAVDSSEKELTRLSAISKELRNSGKLSEPGDKDETYDPALAKLKAEMEKLKDVCLQYGNILDESLVQQVCLYLKKVEIITHYQESQN